MTMFSTCIFCNQPLGANQVLETFPVGRRVAFDETRGRLWVVCRKCERWNLSPIEERWETVEACERLFRDTRVRVSTENIGLARLGEGLELVRIGKPLRPEFAAWRYGDQFGRRRKRAIAYGVGGAAVFGVIVVGGMAAGMVSSGLLAQSGNVVNLLVNGRSVVRFETEDGRSFKLKPYDLRTVRLVIPAPGEEWRVQFQKGKERTLLVGAEARRFAGMALPRLNRTGGSRKTVAEAVSEIEQTGGAEPFLLALTQRAAPGSGKIHGAVTTKEDPRTISNLVKPLVDLPTSLRLATEMALHEEQERRALEGELAELEAAWQAAEEVAAIADDLLLPEGARTFLDRHRSAEKLD
jgi:hypothetical protein